MPDPNDWLLTAARTRQPRHPARRRPPRRPGLVGGQPGPPADPRRDVLRRALRADRGHPRRRPRLLHRLAGRRRRAADRRAGQRGRARCSAGPTSAASTSGAWSGARTGARSASPSDENLQPRPGRSRKRGAEALLDMRVRSRRLPPPEARRDPAPRRPDARHRLRRRHRPVPLAPRRRRPRGRPAGAGQLAKEYGATPPWHDIQAAISGPAVHDVETVFRERWEDPTPLSRNPVILLPRPAARARPDPRPAARAGAAAPAGRRAARTSSSCSAPTRTCAAAVTTRSPAAASAASRAATPRPSSGPRHLVYVEDQYLWGHHVGSVFTEALEAHPDLHVIAVVPLYPDLEGFAGPPQLLGRRRAMLEMARARAGPGGGLRHREPRGHPGLRARQDLHRRRHLGHDRLRQLQPPLLDPRLRAVGGGARPGGRLRADACGSPSPPSTSTAAPDDVDDCVDAGGHVRGVRRVRRPRSTRWHAGGRVGPRPPGRLRRLQPPSSAG